MHPNNALTWRDSQIKSNQEPVSHKDETTFEVPDEFTPARRPQERLTEAARSDDFRSSLGSLAPDPGNTMELGTAGCVIPWRTHYIALGILWEIVYGTAPIRPGPGLDQP